MTEVQGSLGGAVCAALLLALATACGSDETALVISNEQGSASARRLEIVEVLVRACRSRIWSPSDPQLDPARDLPEEGETSIAHGASHRFALEPGCYDFVATRADDRIARARVVLDVGETAHWVPFRIDENESWWCVSDDCDE